MDIREISTKPPKWYTVVALGLPLVVVTVAMPLGFGVTYRQIQRFAGYRPRLFTKLLWIAGALVLAVIVTLVIILVVLGVNHDF
jgi:hypothetical protein